jgi:hypothetical protein
MTDNRPERKSAMTQDANDPGERKLPLVELITALGNELRQAHDTAVKDPAEDMLKLKDCSIELGITWDKKAGGGIEFWVIKLEGEASKQTTQKITVNLEPIGVLPVSEYIIAEPAK